jgi:hypothetical protein
LFKRILLVLGLASLVAVILSLSGPLAFAAPNDAKEACKHGGFANYVDPSTGAPFKNQGQCISFVNHGGTLVPVGDDGGGGGEEEAFVLSGGPSPTDPLGVDDDLNVHLNGTSIREDSTPGEANGNNPPVEFVAKNGDELRIEAVNAAAPCHQRSPLYLHRVSDGAVQVIDQNEIRSCNNEPSGVFYDETVKIDFS